MSRRSGLLINESPLQFLPTLGAKIGVDEALILQQVNYLTDPEINHNFIDGRHWVYNTYVEWCKKFKGCWSESTIKRVFLKLEKLNLLIVGRFNKNKDDRTKWYAVNYDEIDRLEKGTTDQNDPRVKMTPAIGSKRSEASGHFGPLYIEQENTYQENTQENNIYKSSKSGLKEKRGGGQIVSPLQVKTEISMTFGKLTHTRLERGQRARLFSRC